MKSYTEEILQTVVGAFPESPFANRLQKAFSHIFACKKEEAEAAAIICVLYISHLKTEFPSDKLSNCIYNIEDCIKRIYFDCNKYETITAQIADDDYRKAALLNQDSRIIVYEIKKEDLIDALDFYTNR